MSAHIVFHKTCDRCARPYDHQTLKYESGLPARDLKALVLTEGGKQVFSYEDLCPRCEGVVTKLINRLKLEEAEAEAEAEPKKEENSDPEADPTRGEFPF